MKKLFTRFPSVFRTERQTEDSSAEQSEEPTDETAESDVHLFRCPICENVYIATEKSQCSHCETDVEKVS